MDYIELEMRLSVPGSRCSCANDKRSSPTFFSGLAHHVDNVLHRALLLLLLVVSGLAGASGPLIMTGAAAVLARLNADFFIYIYIYIYIIYIYLEFLSTPAKKIV
jgi:hypothetical protein